MKYHRTRFSLESVTDIQKDRRTNRFVHLLLTLRAMSFPWRAGFFAAGESNEQTTGDLMPPDDSAWNYMSCTFITMCLYTCNTRGVASALAAYSIWLIFAYSVILTLV